MRGADDAGLGVGEQQHAAIGAGDAEAEAPRARREAVAARARVLRPGSVDDERVARVDLIGNQQPLGVHAKPPRHAGSVLADKRGLVARADAAVKRSVNPGRNPAASGEKAMGEARQRQISRVERLKFRHRASRIGIKLKAGHIRHVRMHHRHRLEQFAHMFARFAEADEARQRAVDVLQLPRRRLAAQRLGASLYSQLSEKAPLTYRPLHLGALGESGALERGEVDMGGQIGLAGRLERIDIGMARDGLKAFAKRRLRVAVIDEKQRAAIGDDALGDGAHQALGDDIDLDDRPRRRRQRQSALDI